MSEAGRTVTVPLVGGPADGTVVTAVLDVDNRPPLILPHVGADGLAHAALYELESDDQDGNGYRYCFRTFSD
jgi:hypothetical protein